MNKSKINYEKQVKKSHYEFNSYMSKQRWCSIWHQINEVQNLLPKNVLEIGPGTGLFKTVSANFGIIVETLDLDPELKPDHVCSATDMPFEDATYDVVCAFQMLEHLPYETALEAFCEMVRVCKHHVIISLPDARPMWRYQIHVPKLGPLDFLLPRPQIKSPVHKFDGEHYWELNKRGYSVTKIITDFTKHINLVRSYHVPENPSHRFFIFRR
ncbi:MAG: class I SAM-dependent methyltransferase [Methylococcaceae bacterium]